MRRLLTAIVLTVVWVQLAAAQTIREIAQLPAASAISASDSIACQQGGVGTAYTRCTPGAILSAGLPGAFSTLSASSNATITGRLTVGSGAPITGGSRIFDAGYSATAWLMDMQRAGSNAAGARYGALKVSQQITHDGAGSAGTPGAVASLYSSLQVNGQPTTDYWAAGFLTYVTNLADSGATPGQSQHGAMYNQSVRTLDNVAGGTVPPGRQMAEMWGQWQVLSDRTGLKSSEGNSMVGMEFDWDGNNADDGGSRYGYQMVINTYLKNATSDNPFEVKYGWYMNSGTGGVNDAFFNVPLAIYPGYTVAGIDLSQGTGPRANPYIDGTNRAVAIKLADNRAISFDAGDLTTGAILVHGSSKLSYKKAGTEQFSVSDTGTVVAAAAATGPITLSSNTIAAATGQSMTVQTGGTTKTFGVQYPGYGQILTATTNANGNSLFGASPNDLTVANRLTIGLIRTSGPTYTLSGSVTPTSFSGTGTAATVGFAAITSRVIPIGSEVTISGASPSGYNGTWTVTSSDTVSVTFASSATGSLVTAGTMTYKMAAPTLMQMTANWAGEAAASPQFAPFKFASATDTSQTKGTNAGAPIVRIDHNFGGAATGGKHGLQVVVTQTSATNDPPDGVHPNQQHTAIDAHLAAAYNAGGTGTGTLAAGSLYGLNPQVKLQAGATDWRLANGLGEVNFSVAASTVPVTIAGTPGTGDTVTLQFASADISGSPVSVVWTVGASQTATMIANNLEALVNADAALQAAHISAVARSGVVDLYWPRGIATLTITASKTGTVTATKGTTVEGATVDIKLGASIIRLSDDTDTGRLNSAFLLFGSQPDASRTGRMAYGLVFGGLDGYDGMWSWGKESTLIGVGVQASVGGAGKSGVLAPNWTNYGIDFSRVAFNSASLKVPGFEVTSGSGGVIKVGGYQLAATSSGLSIDTNTGKIASSVAITAGGGGGAGTATSNYFIGDVGFDPYGGSYLVTAVNTSTGAVSSMTVLTYPAYQGSAPSTPYDVTGGSGSGWTVTPTYSGSFAPLSLQPTGGSTSLGGTLAIAGNTLTIGGGGTSTIDINQSGSGNWRFSLGGASSIYNFRAVTGGSIVRLTPTSAPVNYLSVTSGNTGGNVLLLASGSDTDVSMTAGAQGAGIWNFTVPITGKFYNAAPGTVTWSGSTTDSATLNPFRMTGVVHTGSSTAAELYLNLLNVAGTDSIASSGKVVGWRFNHNVAAGATGSRNGLQYQIATTGTTSNVEFLTAANFFSSINNAMGGTALTSGGSAGNAFGLNTYATIASGVLNTHGATSYEANVSVREATGTYSKTGIQVVADTADAGPGKAVDAAFLATNQTGAYGFRDAYVVTSPTSQNPLQNTGITSAFRAYYGINYPTFGNRAYWGFNIRELDIAGWAFASKGFSVDGNGIVQVGKGVLETSSTTFKIGATGSEGTSAAVNSGGSNYAVNDILYDSDGAGGTYGGVYKVATLSGSACATVTVLKAPFVRGATPANPVSTTTWQATGQGSGCSIDITWSTGADLALQPSGGDTVIGSGSAISTSSVSGFLRIPVMTGTPTGTVPAGSVVYNTSAGKVCVSAGGGTWTDVVGGAC